MATNYTFAQVVQAYADGTNRELMVEIGKRYPLLMAHVSKLIALAGDEFVAFATSMPEHITANKLNKALLEACSDAAGEANEDIDDEDDANDATDEATDAGDEDLSTKTTKELYNLCIKKRLKVSKYGKPKSYYIDALSGGGESDEDDADEAEEEQGKEKTAKSSKKAADAEPEDDGDDDGDSEKDPYEGKSAMELFKECKKRGLKAVPKKPAKYYIDLLKKDDEAHGEDASGDDDDWGDDEEPEQKPKSNKKSGSKKPAKEDDDEDWDI